MIDDTQTHPHEAGLLQLNCDKAHAHLNWRPNWSADAAITKTAEWYRDVNIGSEVGEVTDRQIREYFYGV